MADEHAPGASPGGPPLLERRLSWRPTLPLIAAFAVLGAAAGAAAVRLESGELLFLALFCAVGIGFLVVVTLGARTVVGVDGVRDKRPFAAELFIPWDEVTDVVVAGQRTRVVALTRRSHGPRTLSGIRDGDPPVDGLDFAGVVAVLRARARAHRAAP
ncbi:hypothetical protein GCM10022221_57770 [Actinocorallia aurea]